MKRRSRHSIDRESRVSCTDKSHRLGYIFFLFCFVKIEVVLVLYLWTHLVSSPLSLHTPSLLSIMSL